MECDDEYQVVKRLAANARYCPRCSRINTNRRSAEAARRRRRLEGRKVGAGRKAGYTLISPLEAWGNQQAQFSADEVRFMLQYASFEVGSRLTDMRGRVYQVVRNGKAQRLVERPDIAGSNGLTRRGTQSPDAPR